jgi:2'-5' RNA ligase
MSIRTFLALDLDEAVRDGLLAAARDFPEADSKIRWVGRDNLHVTVKFLGDVPDADAAAVCEAVQHAGQAAEPFDFHVRGLRCVPPGRKVRMIWAGVREPTERFERLFEQLESALFDLGFPPEGRKFSPHVTLARVKSTRDAAGLCAAAARHAEADFGRVRAEQITVYASELTPRGPIYTPQARPRIGPE